MSFLGSSGISSYRATDRELRQATDNASKARPLWRTDLRQHGLAEVRSWNAAFSGLDVGIWGNEVLAFTDETQVVATSLTPESKAQASPRRLHAVFLDATTGRVSGTSEWTGLFTGVGLRALRGGNFLVRTTHEFSVYSPSLQRLSTFPMPRKHRPGGEGWFVSVTPAGRAIVVEHRVGCNLEVQWLDPGTLIPKRSWQDAEGTFDVASGNALDISDSWLVATMRHAKGNCGTSPTLDFQDALRKALEQKQTCEVAVRNADRSWDTIFHLPTYCPLEARFVNDDTVIFSAGHELFLLGVNGSILLKEQLGKHEFTDTATARSSRDGHRLAVAVYTLKGGSEMLDISAHEVLKRIMVYDLSSRSWVYMVDSKQVDLKNVSGFALSPNGSRLALRRDGFVELYRLPDSESPPQ